MVSLQWILIDMYLHSQVCEIHQVLNILASILKIKLFPATLLDKAKDWFLKLVKKVTSWAKIGEEFLRKYYIVRKTTRIGKVIREFTQGRVKPCM